MQRKLSQARVIEYLLSKPNVTKPEFKSDDTLVLLTNTNKSMFIDVNKAYGGVEVSTMYCSDNESVDPLKPASSAMEREIARRVAEKYGMNIKKDDTGLCYLFKLCSEKNEVEQAYNGITEFWNIIFGVEYQKITKDLDKKWDSLTKKETKKLVKSSN